MSSALFPVCNSLFISKMASLLHHRAYMGGPAPAAAHASPPVPPIESSMRLGSFNVGRGFLRKLPRIVSRCSELELEVVALQEIGDPATRSTVFGPYSLVYSPGPSDQEAGVGFLLSQT